MSRHQALEEFGGLNLIRIAVVKDLTATIAKSTSSEVIALLTRPSDLLLIIVIKKKRQEVEDLNNPYLP